jgi:hypothetical protein
MSFVGKRWTSSLLDYCLEANFWCRVMVKMFLAVGLQRTETGQKGWEEGTRQAKRLSGGKKLSKRNGRADWLVGGVRRALWQHHIR